MADDNNNNDGLFVYTEGVIVPYDVVRVRVHPSVTIIPEGAFYRRDKLEEVELCEGVLEIINAVFFKCTTLKRINIPSSVTRIGGYVFFGCHKLEEVELCDGLLEIGERSFHSCRSLSSIIIPSTVTAIGIQAFAGGVLPQICLPDTIENIGKFAFANNNKITNFRVPPLIASTSEGMFSACTRMFSVEMSERVTDIESLTFSTCLSLRNVAIPPSADVPWDAFGNGEIHLFCKDLLQLFGEPSPLNSSQLINALKHRFDNLTIHKMIYYQSYNNMTVDELNNATDIRISQGRSKINPFGSQQDCLGMTPLHIMACSTVQDIELYKVLVDKYPETLVSEDRWGALPLLYAIWGRAPDEIVQFLVEHYKSVYPNYVLNWTKMIETLGIAGAPVRIIQTLLDLREGSFPDQLIDWDAVIERLSVELGCGHGSRRETFQFLVKCSFMGRINAIGLKHYRDNVINMVMERDFRMPYTVREGHGSMASNLNSGNMRTNTAS